MCAQSVCKKNVYAAEQLLLANFQLYMERRKGEEGRGGRLGVKGQAFCNWFWSVNNVTTNVTTVKDFGNLASLTIFADLLRFEVITILQKNTTCWVGKLIVTELRAIQKWVLCLGCTLDFAQTVFMLRTGFLFWTLLLQGTKVPLTSSTTELHNDLDATLNFKK